MESSIPAKVLVKTDLPEPDSPTMAMDSFSRMSREIPRMAVSSRPRTRNLTWRSLTDNRTFLFSAISLPPYIWVRGSDASPRFCPTRYSTMVMMDATNTGHQNSQPQPGVTMAFCAR